MFSNLVGQLQKDQNKKRNAQQAAHPVTITPLANTSLHERYLQLLQQQKPGKGAANTASPCDKKARPRTHAGEGAQLQQQAQAVLEHAHRALQTQHTRSTVRVHFTDDKGSRGRARGTGRAHTDHTCRRRAFSANEAPCFTYWHTHIHTQTQSQVGGRGSVHRLAYNNPSKKQRTTDPEPTTWRCPTHKRAGSTAVGGGHAHDTSSSPLSAGKLRMRQLAVLLDGGGVSVV